MNMLAVDRTAARARTGWLNRINAAPSRAATGFLLLDTLAAIGFAGGLAGAVNAVSHGVGAVLPWAALAAASGGARGIFTLLAARAGAKGAQAAKLAQRRRVLDSALRRAPGTATNITGLMSVAVDAVEELDGYVARFLPARKAAAAAPLLVLVATAIASPVSACILLGTLLPFIFALALAGGAAADESRRQFLALARLSGRFADRVRALPVVLAFGAQQRETQAIGAAAAELSQRTMKVLRVAFLSSGALEFFAALSVALVAVYCGFNLLGLLPFPVPEKLTLASAFFVLALAPEFYAPMRRLAAAYHDKQAAETAAEALMGAPDPAPAPPPITVAAAPALLFRDVAIRYPGADLPALSALSLDVESGQTVALLGPSGSGKSSLLHLLLGLAPLSQGEVLVDGQPLSALGSLAPLASWAGQHPLLIHDTIRANLLLGCSGASQAALDRAIDAAGLAPMLARRPHGLDTLLDARGGGLSGGERRRLALARALLKPAPLLLLDEPTAHLDAESEAALIATIAAARHGRTTLIATHNERLAAIADRIVRLGESA